MPSGEEGVQRSAHRTFQAVERDQHRLGGTQAQVKGGVSTGIHRNAYWQEWTCMAMLWTCDCRAVSKALQAAGRVPVTGPQSMQHHTPTGRCLKGVDMLFSMSVSAAEHPQRDRVAS